MQGDQVSHPRNGGCFSIGCLAYKKSNGWVLQGDDEPLLQWWANSQRYTKRKSRLSEERIAELDSINFPWNNYEIDYKREHHKRESKRQQSLGRKYAIGTRIKRVSFSTQKVSLSRCPEIHHVLFQCRLSRVTNRSWGKSLATTTASRRSNIRMATRKKWSTVTWKALLSLSTINLQHQISLTYVVTTPISRSRTMYQQSENVEE